MTTVALAAAGYVTFLAFVLILLTAAKRGDHALGRLVREHRLRAPLVLLPGDAHLGRLATELQHGLDVERVAVLVSDLGESAFGQVRACLGTPGLLGCLLPVEEAPATRILSRAEAAALGFGPAGEQETPWALAHVPIARYGEVLGAVVVASHRPRTFTERELSFIERLARRDAREFDRRRGRAA